MNDNIVIKLANVEACTGSSKLHIVRHEQCGLWFAEILDCDGAVAECFWSDALLCANGPTKEIALARLDAACANDRDPLRF
jgi:hypothetical protein